MKIRKVKKSDEKQVLNLLNSDVNLKDEKNIAYKKGEKMYSFVKYLK